MVNKKQRLYLSYEQRIILREKLKERFGSMEDIARAITASTKGKAVTTRNTPINATNLRFYLSPHKNSPTRPITPSVAKAMYELCNKDPEIDFLRESAEFSDIEVYPDLTESELRDKFNDLDDLRAHIHAVHYNGIKSMLDRIYQSLQNEEQRKCFFGKLEEVIEDLWDENKIK